MSSSKLLLFFALAVLALSIVAVVQAYKHSEHFALGAPDSHDIDLKYACEKYGGHFIEATEHNKAICQMPYPVTNAEMMNWQYQGKFCDAQQVYENNRCVAPDGSEPHPSTYTVSQVIPISTYQ